MPPLPLPTSVQPPPAEQPAFAPTPAPLKVLDYQAPQPGEARRRRWSWVGRWTAAAAWAACVVGTALIFGKVETVLATGPILAGLGVILLVAGVLTRRLLWTLLGAGHVAVCMLFLGLVNLRDWSPSDAETPFEVMSVLYTLASAVPTFLAFRSGAAGWAPSRNAAKRATATYDADK